VSAPYQLAKKRVGYAESGGYRFCSACSMAVRPWGPERIQCLQIGVADDPDADVKPGAHCRAWKARLA
jgi:hypothetical protein